VIVGRGRKDVLVTRVRRRESENYRAREPEKNRGRGSVLGTLSVPIVPAVQSLCSVQAVTSEETVSHGRPAPSLILYPFSPLVFFLVPGGTSGFREFSKR
jgi:hypothetical protein